MSKICITGAAGFIGSNLAEALVKHGHQIIGIDDLSTGKIENLDGINVNLKIGNILDLNFLMEVFRDVDYVFHLAAIASVKKSIENPIETNKVGIDGTVNVLEAARKNKIKRIIFASSAAIYGNNPINPKVETMAPELLSPYAISKLTGEYYMKVFYDLYGLETVSLRFFNVYGPKQDPSSEYSGVLSRFVENRRRGVQPIIYGDGNQTRDFIYVNDIVRANLLAMKKLLPGEVYNVGTGRATSLNSNLKLISSYFNNNLDPKYELPRIGDIRYSQANIDKIKAFGFEPNLNPDFGWISKRVL